MIEIIIIIIGGNERIVKIIRIQPRRDTLLSALFIASFLRGFVFLTICFEAETILLIIDPFFLTFASDGIAEIDFVLFWSTFDDIFSDLGDKEVSVYLRVVCIFSASKLPKLDFLLGFVGGDNVSIGRIFIHSDSRRDVFLDLEIILGDSLLSIDEAGLCSGTVRVGMVSFSSELSLISSGMLIDLFRGDDDRCFFSASLQELLLPPLALLVKCREYIFPLSSLVRVSRA